MSQKNLQKKGTFLRQLNKNENTTYQNMGDAAEAMLTGKFTASNVTNEKRNTA